ncbi:beta-glucuronidase-like [Apostichopus japonicus]|uniref:beta-glucuronidase-like n=1 Tax=Stichopus japonicus TaxID=307972 RepID=UPI003AB1FC58
MLFHCSLAHLVILCTTLHICASLQDSPKHDGQIDKSRGMLYPRSSESRTVFELGGVWNFRADMSTSKDAGMTEEWYLQPLAMTGPVIDMPVPASFNDITQEESLRSFIGWVWYDKEFYLPFRISDDTRIVLRVESAHYYAKVWVNGQEAFSHVGGHLPFEGEVSKYLSSGKLNRVTIAVNNTLLPTTLPPGDLDYDEQLPNPWIQNYGFDLFNYAGIHRPVKLYTTPASYIDDIDVTTNFSGTTGYVQYEVKVKGKEKAISVKLKDKNGTLVNITDVLKGVLSIPNVNLWWPYTMNTSAGYRYTLEVHYGDDIYRLPVGVRTVHIAGTKFLINNESFYFHGVNKHEDYDVRGKGLDMPLIIKDFNLLRWLGANSFRTSHYPYAEEIMDKCDEYGIVVIDECPGVGIEKASYMSNQSLSHHRDVMFELVRRDKNRPSVVMWSVANEPNSGIPEAGPYFKGVIDYTRSLDKRPLTFAHSSSKGGSTPQEDLVMQYVDVMCLNRYQAWYFDSGILTSIAPKLTSFIKLWGDFYHRPMIISEYGAGAVDGFHTDPPLMYTEDYQVQLYKEHFKVFDAMKPDMLTGELVWNFADFMTKQEPQRALGNRKGIFTRQRQPKAVAHILRARYLELTESMSCFADFIM